MNTAQSFKKLKLFLKRKPIAFITGFIIIGIVTVFITHAYSVLTKSVSISLTGCTSTVRCLDGALSSNNTISFNGGGTTNNNIMQLLNRRSDIKIYPATAAAASDSDYKTAWNPGNSGSIAYDLSAVPAANRSKINLAWYTKYDDGYSTNLFVQTGCGAFQRSVSKDYTIEVNSAAGGTVPTTGWVTLASVSNNNFFSRQHQLNMVNPANGQTYNWLRMNITNSVSGIGDNGSDLNIDLADASQANNSNFLIIGDSITTQYAGHDSRAFVNGIADMVSDSMGGNGHIITQNAAVSCTTTTGWLSVYSAFSPNPTIDDQIKMFPGKYITLNLGTNDSWGGGNSATIETYASNLQQLITKIKTAGKTPIIPHIPWPNNGNGTVWDNGVVNYNNRIDQIIAANSGTIKGPDLYAVMKGHSDWFQGAGNVHPNSYGEAAMRCAWAYAITRNVYNTQPIAQSYCANYTNP